MENAADEGALVHCVRATHDRGDGGIGGNKGQTGSRMRC